MTRSVLPSPLENRSRACRHRCGFRPMEPRGSGRVQAADGADEVQLEYGPAEGLARILQLRVEQRVLGSQHVEWDRQAVLFHLDGLIIGFRRRLDLLLELAEHDVAR